MIFSETEFFSRVILRGGRDRLFERYLPSLLPPLIRWERAGRGKDRFSFSSSSQLRGISRRAGRNESAGDATMRDGGVLLAAGSLSISSCKWPAVCHEDLHTLCHVDLCWIVSQHNIEDVAQHVGLVSVLALLSLNLLLVPGYLVVVHCLFSLSLHFTSPLRLHRLLRDISATAFLISIVHRTAPERMDKY